MENGTRHLALFFVAAVAFVACGPPGTSRSLEFDHPVAMQDSVRRYFESIPRDLAESGPMAWLPHFEQSPQFFMASDGNLVFPSSDSASAFVRGLSERITDIDLHWTEMRVVPLGPGLAVVGASFRETVTDTAGVDVSFGGFMTGVARRGAEGWRIQHLHWSSPVPMLE